jgi:hypothetical protein
VEVFPFKFEGSCKHPIEGEEYIDENDGYSKVEKSFLDYFFIHQLLLLSDLNNTWLGTNINRNNIKDMAAA